MQNNDSQTAILISAARGDVEVVKVLLDHGADTNLKTNLETWLSRSRLHGHEGVVQIKLEHGTEPNQHPLGSWNIQVS